jgi:hypothetical protein
MAGLLPAILRYTALYEADRTQSRKGQGRSPVTSSASLSATTTNSSSSRSNSSSSSSSSSSSACDPLKKETESVLVRCIREGTGTGTGTGTGEASKGKVNHAIVCLQELYEKSKQRPLPDSGVPLSPPPLLLQTLLWLLIRCAEGERDAVQILLPYCEKFLGTTARTSEQESENSHTDAVGDGHNATSATSSLPALDIDLNFLLRECYR